MKHRPEPPVRNTGRAQKTAARREAILAAALDEFSARGFAATRLEDVARRAGVAKGTIYLHFADKEALFQELVRTMLGPLVASLDQLRTTDLPIRAVLERFATCLSSVSTAPGGATSRTSSYPKARAFRRWPNSITTRSSSGGWRR